MKLKRLYLAGFKTFADRTEIEFGDGITAVVGPNGCGKSNIAEAVLWALGEQNPRALRASEGRDVVFAGTDRRKPLGLAEVRIILDNEDRSLPLDFAEIAIARRVYRSGENRYTINGSACRLKDIVDLFLDTGLGRDAYSFMSQREVDSVLSARPEDRRELFEEAAGVKKYRTRKREAVRKLETTAANLTRVRDIVGEIERQRGPLQAQASVAERYLAMTGRLREIEIGLLVGEVQRADYELYAARNDRELDLASVREFDERLTTLERDSATVRDRLAEAESELDTASLSRQSALTSVERNEHQLQLTLERARHAEATATALEAEIGALMERERQSERDLAKMAAAVQKAEIGEAERRAALVQGRARLREALQAQAEADRIGRDRAQAQRRLQEQRASREIALAACRTRIQETEARLSELRDQRERQYAVVQDCTMGFRAAEERAAAVQCTVEQAGAEHAQRAEASRWSEAELARCAARVEAIRRRQAERTSRLATLKEMHAAGEGMFGGVRAVLGASRTGTLPGLYRSVVDLLGVPEALRVAIDVALGAATQDIVCRTDTEARAAIDWLKAERRGRATFLPLNRLRPSSPLRDSDVSGISGIVGIASRLVECDAEFSDVVALLLGGVIVAETLDAAWKASGAVRHWSRIVTLDGEVLTPGGAVTGGSAQARGAQLVSRKGEIDDLGREAAAIAVELTHAEAALQQASDAASAAATALAEAARAWSDRRADLVAAEQERAQASRDVARAESGRDDLEAESSRLEELVRTLRAEEADWQAALSAGKEEDTAVDEEIIGDRARAEEAARRCEAARADAQALEVEAGRLAEQLAGLKRAYASARSAVEEVRATRAAKQAHREAIGRVIAENERARETLMAEGEETRRRLDECEAQFAKWRDERQARLQQSFDRAAAIKETTSRRADTVASLHDAELRIARLEARIAQHVQRLGEEYGMTLEDALRAPDPGDLDRDVVGEVARLRRDVRAMGSVNTGAAEEYRRLTERYDFLTTQRTDLETACASLRQTIQEIDESTRTVFMSTFDAVAEQFQRLFASLLGGGTTRLVLTEPHDLLETGIEIVAQPPGKKAQSLALLSGGERALTAVALLFSFLAVRPSPFVVLDEVDAPLDGPNVERFVELVHDFARNTQFLIITHNPTTMEGAPCWYGVTMQEPGVSKVISYRPQTI